MTKNRVNNSKMMIKLLIFPFLFLGAIALAQTCPRDALVGVPELSPKGTFKGSECKSLDRNTWDKDEWKSPCDCLSAQSNAQIINRKSHIDSWNKLKMVDDLLEKRIADAIRTQIYTQLEQALRLDIYLKRGIVATEHLNYLYS